MFKAIGKICGGLVTVDEHTVNYNELHWVQLEIAVGDLRVILRLVSIIDNGKFFLVVISIENEDISVESILESNHL